jgi:hypothetical protein
MEIFILAIWALIGVAIGRRRAGTANPWEWAPIAAVFGPLWVGVDQELGDDEPEPTALAPATIPTER